MKIESVKSPNTKLVAIRAGQFALTGYRSMLKTKMFATDMVLSSLSTAARKEKQAAVIWKDDGQIVDLNVTKYYTEQAQILIHWEEVEP